MLKTLEKRVRDIVEERDQGQWPAIKTVLRMASMGYGAGVRIRARLYAKGVLRVQRLPCKVISVGNLTVGGTGKTPMTIYLARQLQRQGKRVAVVSRGYKGAAEKSGGVVSDGRQILMGPEQAGDEPCMMAHQLPGIPVLVGQNRYRSGLIAMERFNPEVILLDDGYQHLRLHRDLNILLLDARRPFGNGFLLPRGKLRESLDACQRAHIAIFTRCREVNPIPAIPEACQAKLSVFRSNHHPIFYREEPLKESIVENFSRRLAPIAPQFIKGKSVYAFSGIADNDAFKHSLLESGAIVSGFKVFADHHQYRESDFQDISQACIASEARVLITTEKDFYRIRNKDAFPLPLIVAGIEINFEEGMPDILKILKRHQ